MTLYSGEASGAVTVTSPLAGPRLIISASYYGPRLATCTVTSVAGVATNSSGTISISPASTLSFTSTLTQSFVITASRPGCYLLNLTVSGPFRANVTSPGPRAISVLRLETPKAGPAMATAQFDATGSQVVLSFAADSNRGGFAGQFACSRIVSFAGASAARCAWSTDAILFATLSGASAIVKPGKASAPSHRVVIIVRGRIHALIA